MDSPKMMLLCRRHGKTSRTACQLSTPLNARYNLQLEVTAHESGPPHIHHSGYENSRRFLPSLPPSPPASTAHGRVHGQGELRNFPKLQQPLRLSTAGLAAAQIQVRDTIVPLLEGTACRPTEGRGVCYLQERRLCPCLFEPPQLLRSPLSYPPPPRDPKSPDDATHERTFDSAV